MLHAEATGSEIRLSQSAQQAKDADLVVIFSSWDRVTFQKPILIDVNGYARQEQFTKSAELIQDACKSKRLAVIILGKDLDAALPDGDELLDAIVERFKAVGFERVIIQLARGDVGPNGLPVLRDSLECAESTDGAPASTGPE